MTKNLSAISALALLFLSGCQAGVGIGVPGTQSEPTPVAEVPPAQSHTVTENHTATTYSYVAPSTEEIKAAIAKDPCPFGLDKSPVAERLARHGTQLQFECDGLNSTFTFNQRGEGKAAYQAFVSMLDDQQDEFLVMRDRPAVIFLRDDADVFLRTTGTQGDSVGKVLWSVPAPGKGSRQKLRETLTLAKKIESTFSDYESRHLDGMHLDGMHLTYRAPYVFPKDVDAHVAEQLKTYSDVTDQVPQLVRELRKSGLNWLSQHYDYELNLNPHVLTLPYNRSVKDKTDFLKEIPVNVFYALQTAFSVTLKIHEDVYSHAKEKRIAAKMIPDLQKILNAVAEVKYLPIRRIEFRIRENMTDINEDKHPQIEWIAQRSTLSIQLAKTLGIGAASTEDILRAIRQLNPEQKSVTRTRPSGEISLKPTSPKGPSGCDSLEKLLGKYAVTEKSCAAGNINFCADTTGVELTCDGHIPILKFNWGTGSQISLRLESYDEGDAMMVYRARLVNASDAGFEWLEEMGPAGNADMQKQVFSAKSVITLESHYGSARNRFLLRRDK